MAQVVPSGPQASWNLCQSTSDWILIEMQAKVDFEDKNKVICFTNPNPPSEIIIAIVGAINQDYP